MPQFSSLLLACLLAQAGKPEVEFAADSESVRIVDGPEVLHAAIDGLWGGWAFSYLVEGEGQVFWSATAGARGPALIGQHPLPGSGRGVRVCSIPFGAEATRVNPPQMLRSPDGYLHAFVGYELEGQRGRIRYLRSRAPEDASAFDDRSELLPTEDYADFHLRQNVGISADGERAVLVTLTAFVPGVHPINTPLIFIGQREERDFRFDAPIAWSEPTPFFYPLVAATADGPVLVGSISDEVSRRAELVHLDWSGRIVFRERLPGAPDAGDASAFELEPLDPADWSRLILVRYVRPADTKTYAIEFWEYSTSARRLQLRRSVPDDTSAVRDFASAGRLHCVAGRAPLFLSEPGSDALYAWKGDVLGRGPLRLERLPRSAVGDIGYRGIRSLVSPSVLQGSRAPRASEIIVACDVDGPAGGEGACCSLLLWRLECGAPRTPR